MLVVLEGEVLITSSMCLSQSQDFERQKLEQIDSEETEISENIAMKKMELL
jgi:hypothetical protein